MEAWAQGIVELTSKNIAGAVFTKEMLGVTFSIKKSRIEIIFKIESHIYTLINMVAARDGKAFIANWIDLKQ